MRRHAGLLQAEVPSPGRRNEQPVDHLPATHPFPDRSPPSSPRHDKGGTGPAQVGTGKQNLPVPRKSLYHRRLAALAQVEQAKWRFLSYILLRIYPLLLFHA
jgi:hypothetical protein